MSQEPLVKFDPAAPSAIIRFDVPQPSFFEGRNIVDLRIPNEDWAEWIRELIKPSESTEKTSETAVKTKVLPDSVKRSAAVMQRYQRMKIDLETPEMQGVINSVGERADVIIPKELYEKFKEVPLINNMKIVKPYDLSGISFPPDTRLKLTKTLGGKYLCSLPAAKAKLVQFAPRLAIIEKYRLENYLGNYGTGKTIASFYIHPKSKINLSIKSWTTVRETYEESSSVFDSYTEKASSAFQTSFSSEKSKSAEDSQYKEYYAEVEAEAGFCGIGSVDAKAGTKGSSSSTRSEFCRNVSNAASQHASEKSSTRQMQHNVTATLEKEHGEEQVLVREIENLNEGHVLNFMIRELNQEYHSVLVLKDVRLAFVVGARYIDEVPLYRIDDFLSTYLDSKEVEHYRRFILKECSYIQDYSGDRKAIFEILNFSDDKPTRSTLDEAIENFNSEIHYIRTRGKREEESIGIGKKVGGSEAGGDIRVEGIPVDVNTVTIKTDGVLCCSLLDPGLALDEHSLKMQNETLRARKAQNDLVEAQVAVHNLAKDLIANGPGDAVARFEKIYSILVEKKKEDDHST